MSPFFFEARMCHANQKHEYLNKKRTQTPNFSVRKSRQTTSKMKRKRVKLLQHSSVILSRNGLSSVCMLLLMHSVDQRIKRTNTVLLQCAWSVTSFTAALKTERKPSVFIVSRECGEPLFVLWIPGNRLSRSAAACCHSWPAPASSQKKKKSVEEELFPKVRASAVVVTSCSVKDFLWWLTPMDTAIARKAHNETRDPELMLHFTPIQLQLQISDLWNITIQ